MLMVRRKWTRKNIKRDLKSLLKPRPVDNPILLNVSAAMVSALFAFPDGRHAMGNDRNRAILPIISTGRPQEEKNRKNRLYLRSYTGVISVFCENRLSLRAQHESNEVLRRFQVGRIFQHGRIENEWRRVYDLGNTLRRDGERRLGV